MLLSAKVSFLQKFNTKTWFISHWYTNIEHKFSYTTTTTRNVKKTITWYMTMDYGLMTKVLWWDHCHHHHHSSAFHFDDFCDYVTHTIFIQCTFLYSLPHTLYTCWMLKVHSLAVSSNTNIQWNLWENYINHLISLFISSSSCLTVEKYNSLNECLLYTQQLNWQYHKYFKCLVCTSIKFK